MSLAYKDWFSQITATALPLHPYLGLLHWVLSRIISVSSMDSPALFPNGFCRDINQTVEAEAGAI